MNRSDLQLAMTGIAVAVLPWSGAALLVGVVWLSRTEWWPVISAVGGALAFSGLVLAFIRWLNSR